MARTIKLEPHLTVDELDQRYKTTADAPTARRWQALWLIAQGATAKAATAVVGLRSAWVRLLVQRSNQHGPTALPDHRHTNPGKAPRLAPAQQQPLATLLAGPAPDGGRWTGPKVAAWITEQTSQPTRPQLGWDYLRRLGFPRPRHTQVATPEEQARWKKTPRAGRGGSCRPSRGHRGGVVPG